VGRPPDEAIVIGDALMTDIAAAHAVGARSILMLTGVSSRADAEALPADERPTKFAADAAALATVLEAFAAEAPAP
jgi:ribonucleotide monophosphatase NagD (HAD superfamily)